MNTPRVCLTSFIFDKEYYNYIPLLIYSTKTAYPDYSVIIFVYGELQEHVKHQLSLLKDFGDFEVRENQFNELNMISPLEGMSTRWILPYENFSTYEYLYIVDIDMIYIAEPKPLHEQHIEHMEYLNLPFSNVMRYYTLNTRKRKSIVNEIKRNGIKNVFNFYRQGEIKYKQLSGLHFVKVDPYFEIVKDELEKFKRMIADKTYRNLPVQDPEVFLYNIIGNSNFDLSKMGVQKNVVEMLDFNNPARADFRPHHGIHLGTFRTENNVVEFKNVLESETYQYYLSGLKEYFKDPLFCDLIELGSEEIKRMINRMKDFYGITDCK